MDILLVVFYPTLCSIVRKKAHWRSRRSQDEHWSDVTTAFLTVVLELDLAERPERVIQAVFNRTVGRLRTQYEKCWRIDARERQVEPRLGHEVDEGVAWFELEEELESQAGEFLAVHRDGHVSALECSILIASDVYGASLHDIAVAYGISYEAAKKRCQRARRKVIGRVPGFGRRPL